MHPTTLYISKKIEVCWVEKGLYRGWLTIYLPVSHSPVSGSITVSKFLHPSMAEKEITRTSLLGGNSIQIKHSKLLNLYSYNTPWQCNHIPNTYIQAPEELLDGFFRHIIGKISKKGSEGRTFRQTTSVHIRFTCSSGSSGKDWTINLGSPVWIIFITMPCCGDWNVFKQEKQLVLCSKFYF